MKQMLYAKSACGGASGSPLTVSFFRKLLGRGAALIVVFFATYNIHAEAKKTEWLAFSIGPVVAIQNDRKSAFSFVSYTPRYLLTDGAYLRANLGATAFKNAAGDLFPVAEFMVIGGYFFTSNVAAELGAGAQNFFNNGGLAPGFITNLVYRLDNRLLLIDRFVLGYAPVYFADGWTHEIRLAAGVTF